MRSKFGFVDPGIIMGVVVALIVLGVGVYAFWVTVGQLSSSYPAGAADSGTNLTRFQYWNSVNNSSDKVVSVFNIIGIVMIIGAIMAIVGLVYKYVRG